MQTGYIQTAISVIKYAPISVFLLAKEAKAKGKKWRQSSRFVLVRHRCILAIATHLQLESCPAVQEQRWIMHQSHETIQNSLQSTCLSVCVTPNRIIFMMITTRLWNLKAKCRQLDLCFSDKSIEGHLWPVKENGSTSSIWYVTALSRTASTLCFSSWFKDMGVSISFHKINFCHLCEFTACK